MPAHTRQRSKEKHEEPPQALGTILGFGWFGLGILGAIVAYATLDSDPILSANPRFWPVMCSLIMAGAGLIIAVRGIHELKRGSADLESHEAEKQGDDTQSAAPANSVVRRRSHLYLFAAMFLYVLILPEVGYVLSTFVFLTASLWIVGFRSPWRCPLVAALLATGTAYLFGNLLSVALPRGSGMLRSLDGIFF